MNSNSNSQSKPIKKLKLSKETIRQPNAMAVTNQQRGVTLNCSLTC